MVRQSLDDSQLHHDDASSHDDHNDHDHHIVLRHDVGLPASAQTCQVSRDGPGRN
jgi:hypothetical protein